MRTISQWPNRLPTPLQRRWFFRLISVLGYLILKRLFIIW